MNTGVLPHPAALALAALTAVATAGCAGGAPQPSGEPVARTASLADLKPSDPVLAFVASAADGTARAVMDPLSGAVTEVTDVSTYFAASGRICKRYRVLQRPAPRETRLMCKDAGGAWATVPALINPDLRGS